jgi:uncharacterized membrane protein
MNTTNATDANEVQLQASKNLTHVIYALYAATIIFGVTSIVAVVINYIKRDEVAGTWLESHFTWQIRTFWWSVLWGVIGIATLLILVGWLVLLAGFVWYVYRIAKGWLRLNDGKPMDV